MVIHETNNLTTKSQKIPTNVATFILGIAYCCSNNNLPPQLWDWGRWGDSKMIYYRGRKTTNDVRSSICRREGGREGRERERERDRDRDREREREGGGEGEI